MRKGSLGTIFGLVVGAVAAVVTMFLSYRYLKVPQIPLDWVALAFSGLTTGLLTFFIVWGHFQSDEPVRIAGAAVSFEEDSHCPRCGEIGRVYRPVWTIIGAVLLFPVGLLLLFITKRYCVNCNLSYQAHVHPVPKSDSHRIAT